MAKNQIQHPRSDETWMKLITESRQSGLTDAEWCLRNGVSKNSFYAAVRRLRKKAYALPERAPHPVLDLTTAAPDIVQIGIIPDEEQLCQTVSPLRQSSGPAMEISIKGIDIRLYNDVSPALLTQTLTILKGTPC